MNKNSTPFHFKQFSIAHNRCAMKVNTDSILLGAVANVSNAKQILDLGTGSGLIAIMLAQRTPDDCHITAIEIEPNACQQALENAQKTRWHNRIEIIHNDLMTLELIQKMDLIVTNPPYFEAGLMSKTAERDLARANSQSHFIWLTQAQRWLACQGKITMILPTEAAIKLIEQAKMLDLYCTESWAISTKTGHKPKRLIITFSRFNATRVEKKLNIYQLDNQYTTEFKALTKAFYLHF